MGFTTIPGTVEINLSTDIGVNYNKKEGAIKWINSFHRKIATGVGNCLKAAE